MTRTRAIMLVVLVTAASAVAAVVLTRGGDEPGGTAVTTPSPSATVFSSGPSTSTSAPSTATPTAPSNTSPAASRTVPRPPAQIALAAIVRATDVPPAPPGDSVVADPAPVGGPFAEVPSVQVESCSPQESGEGVGPPEPGAVAGARGYFVTGVAQVDQYVIVYQDEKSARTALARHRALAQDCAGVLKSRTTPDSTGASARIGAPPTGVDGYRVTAVFTYPGSRSNEASAVLRVGRVVTFLRTGETGAPAGSGWTVDGLLEEGWVRTLMSQAAHQLSLADSG